MTDGSFKNDPLRALLTWDQSVERTLQREEGWAVYGGQSASDSELERPWLCQEQNLSNVQIKKLIRQEQ